MDSFLEWIKTLDWSNICAAMWTFVSVYGISLISLVIGILRLKSKNANFLEKLEQVQITLETKYTEQLEKLKNELDLGLEKVRDNIIEKNTQLNQDKIAAVNKIVEEAKESVEKLAPIKEFNIESVLDKIEELM